MNTGDQRLMRHLVIAVLVKLAVLAGLWWWFVRDARVEVDPAGAAEHLRLTPPEPGDPA